MTTNIQLTIKKIVKASPETLFKAWIEPETMQKFMCPMPGTEITDIKTDPRYHGEYSLLMSVGENSIPIHGQYREFYEFEQLAFTWLSPHVGEDSLVSLRFTPISTNETEIILHHQGFDNEEERNNHDGGWNNILNNLATITKG